MGQSGKSKAALTAFIFIFSFAVQVVGLEPSLDEKLLNPQCYQAAVDRHSQRLDAGRTENTCRSFCNRNRCIDGKGSGTKPCESKFKACVAPCDSAYNKALDTIDTSALDACNAAGGKTSVNTSSNPTGDQVDSGTGAGKDSTHSDAGNGVH